MTGFGFPLRSVKAKGPSAAKDSGEKGPAAAGYASVPLLTVHGAKPADLAGHVPAQEPLSNAEGRGPNAKGGEPDAKAWVQWMEGSETTAASEALAAEPCGEVFDEAAAGQSGLLEDCGPQCGSIASLELRTRGPRSLEEHKSVRIMWPRCNGRLAWRIGFGLALVLAVGMALLYIPALLVEPVPPGAVQGEVVEWWLSSMDGDSKLTQQPSLVWRAVTNGVGSGTTQGGIEVDHMVRYQEVLGIGTSLEASTAYNIALLPKIRASHVLDSLFSVEHGIGLNLARITIGTSDFTPPPFYSYHDDPRKEFSVKADERLVLPLISGALAASRRHRGGRSVRGGSGKNSSTLDNEDGLLLFASSWSPPGWMKHRHRLEGGFLLPKYRRFYAKYLVAFLEAYRRRGIHVHALTVQNEPLVSNLAYPSSFLSPEGEAEVIRWLGPMLRSAGLNTRIWCYDHNWDKIWYPEKVLRDPVASMFIDGIAFHHYSGGPENMTRLHAAYPDKRIFFTEGSTFGAKGAEEIVEIFRNWASTYVAWVTMLDSGMKPNEGPFVPTPTMTIMDNISHEVEFRFDYYMYGQFSKFVRRGAVRIGSLGLSGEVSHVAFANSAQASGPGNARTFVLVAVNAKNYTCWMRLHCSGLVTEEVTLPANSVATFRWKIPESYTAEMARLGGGRWATSTV